MRRTQHNIFAWFTFGMAFAGSLGGYTALAQPPGGGRGGQGGPGGPGGFRGPGGRGGQMRPGGPRQLTVTNVAPSVLKQELKLSAEQATRIDAILKRLEQDRRAAMPRPGGERPDPDTMRQRMEQMRQKEQAAAQSIHAVLTSEQKSQLPTVLKTLGALQSVGIPMPVYGDLQLTAAQKTQLIAIAERTQKEARSLMEQGQGDPGANREAMMQLRQQAHEQAQAILTDAQKEILERFRQEHPGGPGGFGGPGGRGGFGGPGGPGGPPPPPYGG